MDKPYRTSRIPMLIAGVITVIVHLAILANADWLGTPTPEKIAAVGQGAKPEPERGVVYQSLRAPTAVPATPIPRSDSQSVPPGSR